MRIVCEMTKYQYRKYMLSAKWLIPLITLAIVMQMMYSMMPVMIVNSFSISGLVLFGIMVWIGRTLEGIEPEVSEQVLILRLRSYRKYFYCRILFILCISLVITAVAILYPCILQIRTGGSLMTRAFTGMDLIGGGLLMVACSFVGGIVGGLFHNRLFANPRLELVLTSAVALLAICRNGIVAKFAFTKFILWIIPPVSDVVSWFTNEEYFDTGKLMMGFLILMLYGVILAVLEVELLRKKKF